MRFLKSLLLASSCLLSSVSAATLNDAAAPGDDADNETTAVQQRPHEVYTMGFEVETHGIKIQNDNQDNILIILEIDEKWQLTSDTHDDLIDKVNWVNLECRTVGGLNQDEIAKYARITAEIISRIKSMCDQQAEGKLLINQEFAKDWFGDKFLWRLSPDQVITFSTKKQSIADSSVWVPIDFDLRPQLTFSFPMGVVGDLYKKVFCEAALTDTAQPPFLDRKPMDEREPWKSMNLDEINNRNIAKGLKFGPYRAKAHNMFLETGVAEYFFSTSEFTVADGLFFILCGYVYDVFFQNIKKEAMKDTGPKGFIKLVSRVPFNKMYDRMTCEEKDKFQSLFTKFFERFRNLKVKPYYRDPALGCYEQSHEKLDMIVDHERINLGEWFNSIIRPVERARGVLRDLMSPPPHTAKTYSMGAVAIGAIPPAHALLENRGYKISKTEVIEGIEKPISFNIQLDTFIQLIQNESEKFFQLHAIGETR